MNVVGYNRISAFNEKNNEESKNGSETENEREKTHKNEESIPQNWKKNRLTQRLI